MGAGVGDGDGVGVGVGEGAGAMATPDVGMPESPSMVNVGEKADCRSALSYEVMLYE